MASSVIGALRVMLGMDTSDFEDGANSTERTTRRMERNFAQLGDRLQKLGAGMSAAITGPLLGIGAAATVAADKLAQDAERMRIAAETAGAGFEEFQRGAYAAFAGAGIDSEKFADILKDTSDKIGDFAATGGGELQGFFQQIAASQGLTVEDFLGKGSIEQLRLFVSALEAAGVPQEQMVFYLESIADEGSRLLPILRGNGAALDELGRKASIIDPKAAAELKEYTAAQVELDNATRKLTIALVKSGLIEGMTKLVESVASFTAKFAESNPTLFKFTAIAGGVAAALGPVIFGLGGLVKVAGGAVGMFLRLKSAFDIAGLLKNLIPMIASLGRVMLALVASNPLLAALAVAIGLAFAAWQNWDKIEPIIRDLYIGVKTWLQDKLGAIFDWVGKKIEQVTGFFFNMYDAVVGNSYVPDMVDGIGAEFNRLQALMVDPAERATASVTEATRQMASEVSALLDRLFPEFARARQMSEELDLLDKGVADEGLRARARQRLLAERYGGRARVTFDDNPEGPLGEVEKVKTAVDTMIDAFDKGASKTEVQTVRIAETVADMARNISGSIKGLVDGIKSGDFFSIFDAILNVVTTLGGAGLFGAKFRDRISGTPGFANGGAMMLGGLSGIDRNILSLNGSPIARVSRGETMQIRPGNDRGLGGALRVTVTMDESTGALGAFVTDTAGRVVSQAAPAIARTGAGIALDRLSRARQMALA